MPKKSNDLERDLDPDTLGNNPIVASVEPIKKKRVLSEEQRTRQLENLKRGREARKAMLEAKAEETAQMIVDAVPAKPPKEDLKMKRILEAVGSLSAEQEEDSEPEIVVVKKKRAPKKKTIILQEEEETDTEQNSPPPPPVGLRPSGALTPKSAPRASGGQKRQYKKREPIIQTPEPKPEPVKVAPKPQVVFY